MFLDLFIIMEDISKFFGSSLKKRDLIDTSKTDEEDPKKYEKQTLHVLQLKVMFLMKVRIRRVVERFYLIV